MPGAAEGTGADAKAGSERRRTFRVRRIVALPAGPLESNERENLRLTCSSIGVVSKYREKLQLKWRRVGEKHVMDKFSGTFSLCFARKRETAENSGYFSISFPDPLFSGAQNVTFCTEKTVEML